MGSLNDVIISSRPWARKPNWGFPPIIRKTPIINHRTCKDLLLQEGRASGDGESGRGRGTERILRAKLKLIWSIQVWKENQGSTGPRSGQENPRTGRFHSQLIYLKCWRFHDLQMGLCLNICITSVLQCPHRQGFWMNYYGIYFPW